MDAASLFASANLQYVNEEYEEALKHYTCAVTLQDCSEYRSGRAAAYLKLGKFEEALNDAREALRFDSKSYIAMHWKGIALFYLGDFTNSKLSFEESMRASPHSKAPRAVWIRKCDAELSGSTLPLGGVVGEVSKAAVPAVAQKQTNREASRSTVEVSTSQPTPKTEAPVEVAVAGPQSSTDVSISGRKPIKREWYQSNTHAYITIFAKGVAEEKCKAEFQEQELTVSFPLPGSSDEDYQLNLDLFDAIDPSGCKVEVTKVKVEVTLAKKNIGLQWKALERKDEDIVMEIAPAQPAYPTSSKQKKDWSKIDHDLEAAEKEEKPEGDQALNRLFQQIYERADPETRRAMNKSFQTSGGTVLSTNWGEVASADYEGKDRPTPPEGQEWRDWKEK